MSAQAQFEALLPIAVAILLSGMIGLDREWRHSPAGVRTHMLVGMGAALAAVMADSLYGEDGASRILANVITGIGSLGQGSSSAPRPMCISLRRRRACGRWPSSA